jgi:hypothetical protein
MTEVSNPIRMIAIVKNSVSSVAHETFPCTSLKLAFYDDLTDSICLNFISVKFSKSKNPLAAETCFEIKTIHIVATVERGKEVGENFPSLPDTVDEEREKERVYSSRNSRRDDGKFIVHTPSAEQNVRDEEEN